MHAWRLTGILFAGVLTLAVGVLEAAVLVPNDVTVLIPGAITAGVALLTFPFALVWPGLRYRFWRWQILVDRAVIERGVVWRARSVIPRVRIQHVDTRTSPLQRWLGLASLVIYTAGTRGADAEIPGLAAEDAERLREELAQLEEPDERI